VVSHRGDARRAARRAAQRVAVEAINAQFHRVGIFYGFTDNPDLPESLEW
jgi:K+ transporter